MSPLGIFSRKPKIEGQLGYFGLGDWWLSTFSESERRYIENRYQPMEFGSGDDNPHPLTQGKITYSSGSATQLLSGLAGWFNKPEDLSIAKRILDKAVAMGSNNPLDLHYLFQGMIQSYYRARDTDTAALDMAIDACNMQIDNAPKAAAAFKKEHSAAEAERIFGSRLPAHVGYTQLAIIREKQGEYQEAIRLCTQAQKQGWSGDWDKRIARCELRIKKAQKAAQLPGTNCPYCDKVLSKAPKRKTNCPQCGKPIYVRQGELMTESEATLLDG